MDINNGSNIFKYLKDKYGEEIVGLPRNWENTIKKMAAFRNHRHFSLRCLKVRITPVRCNLKHLLHFKSSTRWTDNCCMIESEASIKYWKIWKKHQFIKNTCLKEIILEDDLFTCIWFINKIKEHRHIKTKNRQIDKFKWLIIKNGCHHNQ